MCHQPHAPKNIHDIPTDETWEHIRGMVVQNSSKIHKVAMAQCQKQPRKDGGCPPNALKSVSE